MGTRRGTRALIAYSPLSQVKPLSVERLSDICDDIQQHLPGHHILGTRTGTRGPGICLLHGAQYCLCRDWQHSRSASAIFASAVYARRQPWSATADKYGSLNVCRPACKSASVHPSTTNRTTKRINRPQLALICRASESSRFRVGGRACLWVGLHMMTSQSSCKCMLLQSVVVLMATLLLLPIWGVLLLRILGSPFGQPHVTLYQVLVYAVVDTSTWLYLAAHSSTACKGC